jgi:hypothetical protein
VTLVYTLRFRHLWRFNAVHQLRSIPFQCVCMGFALLLVWIALHGSACHARGGCAGLSAFVFALGYIVLLGFQFLFNAAFLFARNNRSVLTEHRVELQAEGVYEETAYNRSLFLWPGINRVVSAAGFVAVYVTAHSALVIPNRTFASPSQRDEFIRSIRAKTGE